MTCHHVSFQSGGGGGGVRPAAKFYSSLVPYLEQLVADSEIDYVHYSVCQPNPSDLMWLRQVAEVMPKWFELRQYNLTNAKKADAYFIATYNEYQKGIYHGATMVKIDDDIVSLSLGGTITRAIEYAKANPSAAWVSGLVVNHPIFDSWLQMEGTIPNNKDMDFTKIHKQDGILGNQNNTIYAEQPSSWRALHSFFLANFSTFQNLEGALTVPVGSRVSLNFRKIGETPFKRKLPTLPGS